MAGRKKQQFPQVPKPGPQRGDRSSLAGFFDLVKMGLKMGMGPLAVNVAKNAYEFFEERNFKPFKPGVDYEAKPMKTYLKSDVPNHPGMSNKLYNVSQPSPTPDAPSDISKGSPEILKVAPEEKLDVDSRETNVNNPDEFQFYGEGEIQTESDLNARSVMDELKSTDINTIEDFEKPKKYKQVIDY